MKALILAAGYGTRLYPLTLNSPKPLLELGEDKRILDAVINKISVLGPEQLIAVSNHRFFKDYQDWSSKKNISLEVLDDGTTSPEDRLGAIGDIYFAVRKLDLDDDLLVIGGDNLFNWSLEPFKEFYLAKSPKVSIGLYDIKDIEKAKRFGIVELDWAGKVIDFSEKPENPRSTLAAMCLYYFPRESLKSLQRYMSLEGLNKDAPGNFISWLHKEDKVYGYPFEGEWLDIGHKDTYAQARQRYEEFI